MDFVLNRDNNYIVEKQDLLDLIQHNEIKDYKTPTCKGGRFCNLLSQQRKFRA